MLATPKLLSNQVVHILVLRLESVSRFERTGSLIQVRANEGLGSCLSVGPAGRALRGLVDECVQTTYQVPRHDEGIVGARPRLVRVDRNRTLAHFGETGVPRYLRGSTSELRGRSRRDVLGCH